MERTSEADRLEVFGSEGKIFVYIRLDGSGNLPSQAKALNANKTSKTNNVAPYTMRAPLSFAVRTPQLNHGICLFFQDYTATHREEIQGG